MNIMKNLIIMVMFTATTLFGGTLSPKEASYFKEIALNDEFIKGNQKPIIKWEKNIRLKVHEEVAITQEDRDNLTQVVAELNALLANSIQIQLVEENPNANFYFTDRDGLKNKGGRIAGATTVWGNPLDTAVIAVDVYFGKNNNGTRRLSITHHLVREEITQTLGLLADSKEYPDSIFFEGYSETRRFSELDKALIKTLYSPAIKMGMHAPDVEKVLGELSTTPDGQLPPSITPPPYDDPNADLREALREAEEALKAKESVIATLQAHQEESNYRIAGLEQTVASLEARNFTPYTHNWFYDPEKGWLWTNPEVFPYIYSAKQNAWLRYDMGSTPRLFYNYAAEQWEKWE